MKILTHICCGPCGMVFTSGLARDGFATTLLWYNPNIHPLTEYRLRKRGAVDFAENGDFALIADEKENYGLRPFLAAVWDDFENKCEICCRMRLEHTARRAAAGGFDAFSTTLLASPYQNHDAISRIGKEIGDAHGIEFFARDYRATYRAGLATARGEGIYMQKYCGCVFSEEERYRK